MLCRSADELSARYVGLRSRQRCQHCRRWLSSSIRISVMGQTLPRKLARGAAVMPPITDAGAEERRGRNGPNSDILNFRSIKLSVFPVSRNYGYATAGTRFRNSWLGTSEQACVCGSINTWWPAVGLGKASGKVSRIAKCPGKGNSGDGMIRQARIKQVAPSGS
jgi:hypothetical protein